IGTQPAAQTVTAGQTATFSVTATGTAPFTYQWKKGGDNIAGATSSSYTMPATSINDHNAVFTVEVSNAAGSPVTSNPATLTVNKSSATGYSLVAKIGGTSYDKTECVQDNVTGLIWEGKTASPVTSRLGLSTYTNYDSSYTGGTDITVSTNSIGYANSVNAERLCGYTDWRLPTKEELQGILASSGSPKIDTTWFPNTQAAYYWSSSPSMGGSSSASIVGFSFGSVASSARSGTIHVRLVR
ncbi:MAG: DUF1566 domain-containing protein, partial [Rhodoferax sp.]|nr:DUF1566 domain-containing protein [Rhodoferax sp.]